jgi:uncharacterized protein (DUF58 family)
MAPAEQWLFSTIVGRFANEFCRTKTIRSMNAQRLTETPPSRLLNLYNTPTMTHLPPDVLNRIDKLELDARQVVEGYLAGRHRSPRHGFATEFSQHREYAPGDDIRHIDWKVYARTERYHLKQYEQETNLVAWMVLDASESMKVATVKNARGELVSKYEVACILAGALGYLITQQADSLGFQMYAETLKAGGRAAGGTGRVRELLRWFAGGPYAAVSNTGKALRDMGGLFGRRGIVFLFSDLLDDAEDLLNGLRILRSQKHEVVVFQVLDAAEVDFHFTQPTLFKGLEELPEVSTDPQSVRESYLAALREHLSLIENGCRAQEIDYSLVRTDEDLGRVLASYLQKRQSR